MPHTHAIEVLCSYVVIGDTRRLSVRFVMNGCMIATISQTHTDVSRTHPSLRIERDSKLHFQGIATLLFADSFMALLVGRQK